MQTITLKRRTCLSAFSSTQGTFCAPGKARGTCRALDVVSWFREKIHAASEISLCYFWRHSYAALRPILSYMHKSKISLFNRLLKNLNSFEVLCVSVCLRQLLDCDRGLPWDDAGCSGGASPKRIGCTWSYLACRIGRFVPIQQPYIGSSFQ
jgi:hypothetical protein